MSFYPREKVAAEVSSLNSPGAALALVPSLARSTNTQVWPGCDEVSIARRDPLTETGYWDLENLFRPQKSIPDELRCGKERRVEFEQLRTYCESLGQSHFWPKSGSGCRRPRAAAGPAQTAKYHKCGLPLRPLGPPCKSAGRHGRVTGRTTAYREWRDRTFADVLLSPRKGCSRSFESQVAGSGPRPRTRPREECQYPSSARL